MSDDFEDARIFLELCYFTVSLISDTMNPIQYFKSDFVILIQPVIEKFVSQFPSPNERQIVSNASYRKLVQAYVSKIRPLIDALKQSGLWIPQGTSPASIDATELISTVLNSEQFDVEQLMILRGVRTNQLLYSPELTLYFNACLLCCQSQIVIVRLYAYSLLRAAPVIVDLRHLFNVLKTAISIWEKGPVSFEFTACLFILLTKFSEHRPSSQDENEYDLILQMLKKLHNSNNFETLMCFDPTLRWMFSCFPTNLISEIFKAALPSLKENHSGDFCIICHCLAIGIGDPEVFPESVKCAISSVPNWAHPIQKEARSILATLPLCAPKVVTTEVIDIISSVLTQPAQTSEASLFIFAQFLIAYFLGTSAPLHMNLFQALLNNMPSQNDAKKNLTLDIQNIVIAICSNPVRLLEILTTVEQRTVLLSILSQTNNWENTLSAALCNTNNFPLASDSAAKSVVKMIKERPLTIEEKDNFEFIPRLHIDLPLMISLYPNELKKLVEHLDGTVDEDLENIILEVFCIVALQERNVNECRELLSLLPSPHYKCEYTELLNLIQSSLKTKPSPFEQLSAHIDNSLNQFLTIGSASNTAAALLFEHIIWTENKLMLTVCKRIKLRPALWFASAVASLFSSIVSNPTNSLLQLIDQKAKNSAEHLVWIAYILFNRLVPSLREIIVKEEFQAFPKTLYYPMIEFQVTPDEIATMDRLHVKYQPVLKELFGVMVPTKSK